VPETPSQATSHRTRRGIRFRSVPLAVSPLMASAVRGGMGPRTARKKGLPKQKRRPSFVVSLPPTFESPRFERGWFQPRGVSAPGKVGGGPLYLRIGHAVALLASASHSDVRVSHGRTGRHRPRARRSAGPGRTRPSAIRRAVVGRQLTTAPSKSGEGVDWIGGSCSTNGTPPRNGYALGSCRLVASSVQLAEELVVTLAPFLVAGAARNSPHQARRSSSASTLSASGSSTWPASRSTSAVSAGLPTSLAKSSRVPTFSSLMPEAAPARAAGRPRRPGQRCAPALSHHPGSRRRPPPHRRMERAEAPARAAILRGRPALARSRRASDRPGSRCR
jgi:hypothetical protein